MMDIQLTSVEAAIRFLSRRNPFDHIDQIAYAYMLMEFQDKKGDEAIEALAGAYIWAIDHYTGGKQSEMILEVFGHDLGERNNEWTLPRSSSYKQFWDKEFLSWQ